MNRHWSRNAGLGRRSDEWGQRPRFSSLEKAARKAESQDTYPSRSKLTLFARKGVAKSLASFREAFLFACFTERTAVLSRHRCGPRLATNVACARMLVVRGLRRRCRVPMRSRHPREAPDNDGQRVVTDEVGRRVEIPARSEAHRDARSESDGNGLRAGTRRPARGRHELLRHAAGGEIESRTWAIRRTRASKPSWRCTPTWCSRRLRSTAVKRLTRSRQLGNPVYTSDPHTVRGMLDSIARMADVMGAEAQGATLVAQVAGTARCAAGAAADRPLVHVLFVVWEDPLITIGQNTFIADALRWAGAESVVTVEPELAAGEHGRSRALAAGLHRVHAQPYRRSGHAADSTDLRSRPGWKDLQAVELGHVVVSERRSRGPRRDWSTRSSSSRANCIRKSFPRKAKCEIARYKSFDERFRESCAAPQRSATRAPADAATRLSACACACCACCCLWSW